jgi:uncharacterized protein YjbJ (UPF0337 family)
MGAADKASNEAQDLKGRVKEAAGKATDNRDLEVKGKTDRAKAAAKDVGESIKDAAGRIGDAATR